MKLTLDKARSFKSILWTHANINTDNKAPEEQSKRALPPPPGATLRKDAYTEQLAVRQAHSPQFPGFFQACRLLNSQDASHDCARKRADPLQTENNSRKTSLPF